LIEAERAALEYLATVDGLDLAVPRILGAGEFGDGLWLATSQVRVERRQRPSRASMLRIARSVEASTPASTTSLGESAFGADLLARSEPLPASGPVVAALLDQAGEREISFRGAHGDFVPWNILSGDPKPGVWDWERYSRHTPAGFDRLHYALQVALHRQQLPTAAAVGQVQAELGELLPEMTPFDARLSLDCYLAALMCRYEHDAAESGVHALATRSHELAEVLHQRGRAQ
jgi:hypothetical protein